MNLWHIAWVFEGHHTELIQADTLEFALKAWREAYPHVTGLALYAIVCVK